MAAMYALAAFVKTAQLPMKRIVKSIPIVFRARADIPVINCNPPCVVPRVPKWLVRAAVGRIAAANLLERLAGTIRF